MEHTISTSELQINNHVLYNGEFSIITSIQSDMVGVKQIANGDYVTFFAPINQIKGVDICTAYLEMLGFKNLSTKHSIPILYSGLFIDTFKGEKEYIFEISHLDHTILIAKYKYLHQLQNLLSVLTQKSYFIN